MFTKNIFKNKSKRKRNFIYHFLAENKLHQGIDLLITASVNVYQIKKKRKKSIPTVMKTCFTEEKLMKQFGARPPFLRELPFQLTPLFLSHFLMIPLFVQILKTRNTP